MMATDTKIKIISTETVKPSRPTPDHLKLFKLSLFDQVSPDLYVSIVLFYPAEPTTANTAQDKLQRLKSSLSRLLTRFYHFAGSIKDNLWIECTDDNVKFIGAKADCQLSHVLDRPCPLSLQKLLPIHMEPAEASVGNLLLIQFTSFECGGSAVGVSISHKIIDAASLSTFLKVWSSVALDEEGHNGGVETPPLSTVSTLFPPVDYLTAASPAVELPNGKCVTRRYVFNSPEISKLITRAASAAVPKPTRVEAVLGLLWQCAAIASTKRSGSVSRGSALYQVMNIRQRLLPEPLPESTMGNLVGSFITETVNEEREIELKKLVSHMRKAKLDYMENEVKRLGSKESFIVIFEGAERFGEFMSRQDLDLYYSTSWCRFELYDADFGWGKPTWVSLATFGFKNTIVLMDSRDAGGIEVWLTVNESDMNELDGDEELLQFASLNPSVSCTRIV